jgi:hypothetical protein
MFFPERKSNPDTEHKRKPIDLGKVDLNPHYSPPTVTREVRDDGIYIIRNSALGRRVITFSAHNKFPKQP